MANDRDNKRRRGQTPDYFKLEEELNDILDPERPTVNLEKRQNLAELAQTELRDAVDRDDYEQRYNRLTKAARGLGVDEEQFGRFAVSEDLMAPAAEQERRPNRFFDDEAEPELREADMRQASRDQAKAEKAKEGGFSGLAELYEMQADKNAGSKVGGSSRGRPIASLETRLTRIAKGLRRQQRMRGGPSSPIASMLDQVAASAILAEEKDRQVRDNLSAYGQEVANRTIGAEAKVAQRKLNETNEAMLKEEEERQRRNARR